MFAAAPWGLDLPRAAPCGLPQWTKRGSAPASAWTPSSRSAAAIGGLAPMSINPRVDRGAYEEPNALGCAHDPVMTTPALRLCGAREVLVAY